MRRLFHDDNLQSQFDKDGYVNIDFMAPREIGDLINLYDGVKKYEKKEKKNMPTDFDCTFFFSDLEYRKRVYDTFGSFFQTKLEKLLVDYKYLIINIYDKPPGGIGEVPVHMDWSFVDESEYTSVSVWVPLHDVNRKNGTLELIKGSHKLQPYRHQKIPYLFDGLWDKLTSKYLTPQNLRAGQICIFDSSIIHWSDNNHSNKMRTAIQLVMAPEEAPVHLYYKDPGKKAKKLEKFIVDAEFYMNFHVDGKPESSRSCGFVEYKTKRWTEKEMVKKIAKNNPGIWDNYKGRSQVHVK